MNNNVVDDEDDDLLFVAKVVLVIPVANQTVGEDIDSSDWLGTSFISARVSFF